MSVGEWTNEWMNEPNQTQLKLNSEPTNLAPVYTLTEKCVLNAMKTRAMYERTYIQQKSFCVYILLLFDATVCHYAK